MWPAFGTLSKRVKQILHIFLPHNVDNLSYLGGEQMLHSMKQMQTFV